ncbi:hypothetical protein [Nocardia sp. XZ_19_369]|uniref:hypothetical protein n=1 Tax=Nocardia sp. XZ_19_369 TaxID=2769487 RepID=UPI00188ECC5A|nr:hypothetical protein [Nocardia sp. XZ_19_369]
MSAPAGFAPTTDDVVRELADQIADRITDTPQWRELQQTMMAAAAHAAAAIPPPDLSELFDQDTLAHLTDSVQVPPLCTSVSDAAAQVIWDNPHTRAAHHGLHAAILNSDLHRRIAATFAAALERRRGNRRWWLPRDLLRTLRARVTVRADTLPRDRHRRLAALIHTSEQRKAVLRHRYRPCTEPPGQLLTARGHLTRGPNTHEPTSISTRLVGPARA